MISRIVDGVLKALGEFLLTVSVAALAMCFLYFGPGMLDPIQLGVMAAAGAVAFVGAAIRQRWRQVARSFCTSLLILGLLASVNALGFLLAPEAPPVDSGPFAQVQVDLPVMIRSVTAWSAVLVIIASAVLAWLPEEAGGQTPSAGE